MIKYFSHMYKIGLQMPSRVGLACMAKRLHTLCNKLDLGFESHLCLFTSVKVRGSNATSEHPAGRSLVSAICEDVNKF